MAVLQCGAHALDLTRPRVMGILNVTPDSFSDGGRFATRDAAVRQARQLVAEGADLIDVGGESTRPGAAAVSIQDELDRVIPVIEDIAGELTVPVSIDTSKPEVMRAAVRAGATLINDVAALRRPGALAAAAALGVPVCLMHMQGEPRTMQRDPGYRDVVGEVRGFLAERLAACEAAGIPRGRLLVDPGFGFDHCLTHMQGKPRTMQRDPGYRDVVGEVQCFLAERLAACEAAGIPRERLLVDPGFGFGKTLAHNLALLRGLPQLRTLGVPVLVGLSRKSMIGALLGDVPAGERLYGSVAAAVLAAERGAAIVRVHDVGPTVQALRVLAAVGGDAGD